MKEYTIFHARELDDEMPESLIFDDIEVQAFRGRDGKPVIQINSPAHKHIAPNGQPVLRVLVDGGRIWEGFEAGYCLYGEEPVRPED